MKKEHQVFVEKSWLSMLAGHNPPYQSRIIKAAEAVNMSVDRFVRAIVREGVKQVLSQARGKAKRARARSRISRSRAVTRARV